MNKPCEECEEIRAMEEIVTKFFGKKIKKIGACPKHRALRVGNKWAEAE